MLDNGYVYLAATRLTAFRSNQDWAITIEVFGFSPRSGYPDLDIRTFGSKLANRKSPKDYVNRDFYERYLVEHKFDESHYVYPIGEDDWIDEEFVAADAREIRLRDRAFPLPSLNDYENFGINLGAPPRVQIFELCRYVAGLKRSDILATVEELRVNVPPEMQQVLQLDEWNHPDVCNETCRPSGSETFRQIAEVLVTGDAEAYCPTQPANTHWLNWPDGGTL
jgi:hypothetical protein